MKKTALFMLILLTGYGVKAQKLISKSQARQPEGLSKYNEDFTIKVEFDALTVKFERYDSALDEDLKEKIRHFFKNPPITKYNQSGKYDLHIVKKDNQYYVLDGKGVWERFYKLE